MPTTVLAPGGKSKVKIPPKNPRIVKEPLEKRPVVPSEWVRVAQQDTEEKREDITEIRVPRVIELLDIRDQGNQLNCGVPLDEPLFQPFPSEIIYQKFEPCKVYEQSLQLRNNDQSARLVKVTHESSAYFKIIPPKNPGDKVAPGMTCTFKIQFLPDERKDYLHEIVVVTDREKFAIPIRAINGRAILDFPDEVKFSPNPVKNTACKTLFVRNIGDRECRFTCKTRGAFDVEPKHGVVPIGGNTQLIVNFHPITNGCHNELLDIHYDTGEDLCVRLSGVAMDVNIRLDKSTVRMENTFISLTTKRTVGIVNRSDVIAKFTWKLLSSAKEDEQFKESCEQELAMHEQNGVGALLPSAPTEESLEESNHNQDPSDQVQNSSSGQDNNFPENQDPAMFANADMGHKRALMNRTFVNKKNVLHNEHLQFSDDVFSVFPLEGEVWPNTTLDCEVLFKPREVDNYDVHMYLEVTGREGRLPIRLHGTGVGPQIDLSFETLNVGNIFLGSRHFYEVILWNKGDIDAIYAIQSKEENSALSSCFSFDQMEAFVPPGGYQAIKIELDACLIGPIDEVFEFQVDGMKDTAPKIYIRGHIVGPTFNFSINRVKMGHVPFGFLTTVEVNLVNTSLVPLNFQLVMSEDGDYPAVAGTEENADFLLHSRPDNRKPQEFRINPTSGLVPAQSSMKISIGVLPNTLGKVEREVLVFLKDIEGCQLALPVSARVVAPDLKFETAFVDMGKCFLRFPYEQLVTLTNPTSIPARYELIPQDRSTSRPPIQYDSPKSWGVIDGNGSVDVPMVFQVGEKGEHSLPVTFSVFGSPHITLQFIVQCFGEGPVALVEPTSLDWGKVRVLERHPKTVTIKNESLISAKFKCRMRRADSVFSTEPSSGVIEPGDTVDVAVFAKPNDTFQFTDNLLIGFDESATQTVVLSATGFGPTIVTDPVIEPFLDFGPQFSQHECTREVLVHNQGRRIQRVHFLIPNSAEKKASKGSISKEWDGDSCFKIVPNRLTLEPNHSETIKIVAFSQIERAVSEDLVVTSIIGKLSGKETVSKSKILCSFINPVVHFSDMKLHFQIQKRPTDVLELQSQQLSFVNTSSLPVTANFDILSPSLSAAPSQPFHSTPPIKGISNDETEQMDSRGQAFFFLSPQDNHSLTTSTSFEMEVDEECSVVVVFDPNYISESAHTRHLHENIQVTYSQHPNKDLVALSSIVYFPNLDFETKIVHFGCVVNETEVTRRIKVTNSGPLPVNYRWSFKVDQHSSSKNVLNTEESGKVEDVKKSAEVDKVTEVVKHYDEDDENSKDLQKEKDDNEAKLQQLIGDDLEIASIVDVEIENTTESFVAPLIDNNAADDQQQITVYENRDHVQNDISPSLLARVDLDEEELIFDEDVVVDVDEVDNDSQTEKQDLPERLEGEKDASPDGREREITFQLNESHNEGVSQKHPPAELTDLYDIHPLFGHLAPGESETVSFTFFGHVGVKSEVIALCDVEGGPVYELQLSGEASSMHYNIDSTEIDLGLVRIDEMCESQIVVTNTSKVELTYRCASIEQLGDNVYVGCPIVENPTGTISQFTSETVKFKFIAGTPDKFSKSFKIQVSHFEPVEITVKGHGIFPRFALDLPRTIPDRSELLYELISQAEKDLVASEDGGMKRGAQFDAGLIRLKTFLSERRSALSLSGLDGVAVDDTTVQSFDFINDDALQKPSQLEILMEMERLILMNHTAQLPTVYPKSSKPKFMSIVLPGYELDFGFVILGDIVTKSVRLINNGNCPVSLFMLRSLLQGTGFVVDMDRIRSLPGAPEFEMTEFHVHFDPRGANLDLGPVQCEVPIHVQNGPSSALILKAHVTMPSMTVSDSLLDFGQVLCSQCKIITVQFFNHKRVTCEWMVASQSAESKKGGEKEQPWRKKKDKESSKSVNVFEVIPSAGVLLPGQRYNVQIKFMPLQQRNYDERLTLKISHSSYKVGIQCSGSGVELGVQFSKNFLEFGPCLPHSVGDEQEVLITNPTDFPIEIYSVEFDNQYIDEEKTLRMMKGWDRDNCILLPPREAGQGLPKELTDFYAEHIRKVKLAEKKQAEKTAAALMELTADDDDTESRRSSTGSRSIRSGVSRSGTRVLSRAHGRRLSSSGKNPKREDVDSPSDASDITFDQARHGKEDRKSAKSNKSDEDKLDFPADGKTSKRSSDIELSPADVTQAPGDPSSLDTTQKQNLTIDGASVPGETSGTGGNQTLDQSAGTQGGAATSDSGAPNAPVQNTSDAQGPPEDAKDKGVGDLEITPVTAAIARYLNIDLSPEGKAAENRRGIAIVVYGAPESGKSTVAQSLESKYGLCTLNMDEIVLAAIKSGDSAKALAARQACAKAMYDKLHPEGKTPEEEAREAATARATQAVGSRTSSRQGVGRLSRRGSLLSNSKQATSTSIVTVANAAKVRKLSNSSTNLSFNLPKQSSQSGQGSDSKLATEGSKDNECLKSSTSRPQSASQFQLEHSRTNIESAAQKPAPPASQQKAGAKGAQQAAPVEPPQPETLPAFPVPRKLTELDSIDTANTEGFLSCHLPEDVLVELVSERLQSRDCFKGVVFDGLESLFTPSILVTVQILLKAINNRKYIYFVETSVTQAYLKEQSVVKEAKRVAEIEELKRLEQKRIEEMSEDEFEALSPRAKAEVEKKQLRFKREKMKRIELEKEKQKEEEEQRRLDELARQEAERQAKKKKKADASKTSSQGTTDKSNNNNKGSQNSINQSGNMGAAGRTSSQGEVSGIGDKGGTEGGSKKKGTAAQPPAQPAIEEEAPVVKLTEQEIIQNTRFKFYEMFKNDIIKLLERWDRTKGQTGRPLTPGDDEDAPVPRHAKRYKVGPPIQSTVDHEEEAHNEEAARGGEPTEKEEEARANMENLGVPLIQINVANPELKLDSCVFEARVLPSYEELHEGLGMGTTGPPVPPPATFSVVPFPIKRKPHIGADPSVNFSFIAAGLEDPNLVAEREMLAKKREEEQREKEEALLKKGKKEKESSREKDSKSSRTGTLGGSKEKTSKSKKASAGEEGPASGAKKTSKSVAEPAESMFGLVQEDGSALPRLNILRWVVGPKGERVLRIRFIATSAGQFDQTLNFELVGTRRRYQLHLRGISCFPSVSREPRVLFPSCKKVLGKREIAKKCYVGTSNCFEFGPLLLNKKRDEKDTMYPENMEKFTFFNDSLLHVEMSLCFLQDSQETTFIMDRQTLSLSVGERKVLTVWAYPKTLGDISDVIVCCIKDNPEPLLLKVSCNGCKPQLEIPKVDGKVAFQFDKVLLHRKDTKTIPFRNPTKLPAAWKIIGMDSLRDDVTLSAEQGIVPPLSESMVTAVFKATKAGPLPKKTVKMEVTDVDKIMGVVQTEQVVATGEAYDVLLDMSFPKGPEGGLDFGSCRVGDENIRQTLSLKNKGKYEIQYQFIFEQCGLPDDPTKFFSITPSSEGSLSPSDRPTNVTLAFFTKKEFSIKNVPIIKCKIVEPSQGDTGEVIAIIPIKVSVRAIFSRFKISPSHDLNFGPICSGQRKQKFFTIENLGEFDFKYNITRAVSKEDQLLSDKKGKRGAKVETARSRDASVSSKATLNPKGGKKSDVNNPAQPNAGQFKLSMEAFNLSPAFGFVLTGTQQVIQVEAYGDSIGHFEEELLLDISDRVMTPKTKNGIPFKLISDVCNPVIETTNYPSIFEEHVLCKNLRNYKSTSQYAFCGVYGEDENRFVFSNVIVGEKAKARFKIVNPSKVAADVTFSIKSSVQSKSNKQTAEVFEVSPHQVNIASHSHVYAVVTFSPATMQNYSTVFEAMVDGVAQFTPQNYFSFDISGEATLPRLTVGKPTLQNSRGQPLLLFKKLLVGHAQKLPIVLKNEGELVCRAYLDIEDQSDIFAVEAGDDVTLIAPNESMDAETNSEEEKEISHASGQQNAPEPLHKFMFELRYQESATFWVTFVPKEEKRYHEGIKVVVDKNNFEELDIVLVGEGYSDFISIDNVHGAANDITAARTMDLLSLEPSPDASAMMDDSEIKAPKTNHLNFGDVYLNEKRQMSFTLSNHSKDDLVRFEFPADHSYLAFTPSQGHLRPNCAKDIVVIFRSTTPVDIKMEEVVCSLKKIRLINSTDQTPRGGTWSGDLIDWDDSMKTIQWIDIRREKTTIPSADLHTDPDKVKGDANTGSVLSRRRTGAASSDKSGVSRAFSPKNGKSGSQRSSAVVNPPFKKKMTQVEPEPKHEVVEGSSRDVELYYSVVSDYSKFKIDSQNGTDIHFKDTLMFQSRIYEFRLENNSKVNFEYEWQAVNESNLKSVSFAHELEEQRSASIDNSSYQHHQQQQQQPPPNSGRQLNETPIHMAQSPHHQRGIQSTQSNVSTVNSLRVSVMPDSAADFLPPSAPTYPRSGAAKASGYESPVQEDIEVVPFLVEPPRGVVRAGLSQTFKVKFCPLDVKEFNARLLCRIPNLEEGVMGPVVAVHGKSLLPYVHFELEDSDYLASNKRSHLGDSLFTLHSSSVPLDPNTRVLEFSSCGVNRTIKRTFRIINPTKNPFFFSWAQSVTETEAVSSNEFRCLKKSGQILVGKSIDALFEFRGRKLGSFETFWTFQIPKLGIEVPFLLVGHVAEPAVTLDRNHINFKSLLIGTYAEETLYIVNHENESYKVAVDEASLIEPDTGEAVQVTPKSFSVGAKSRAPIKLRFYARLEKEINFNVAFTAQFKSMPLRVNVKAVGYAMDSQLFFHESENEKLEMSHAQVNEIDFGEVEVNDKLIKTFSITNSGKYIFEYSWSISQPQLSSSSGSGSGSVASQSSLSVEAVSGSVGAGESANAILTWHPRHKYSLSGAFLNLNVKNGPKYKVALLGLAVRPSVKFSFRKHNFGYTFLASNEQTVKHCTLVISNHDCKTINVDCLFTNQPHLRVSMEPGAGTLEPDSSCQVLIEFAPAKCVKYQEVIKFLINGLTETDVVITGYGCDLKLDVMGGVKNKICNLGAIRIGQVAKKRVHLVNHSLSPVSFSLFTNFTDPALCDYGSLSLWPDKEITLAAKTGCVDIDVKFHPKARVPQFLEEVLLEVEGIPSGPLFALSGCCQATEVTLDCETIPFGAVTLNSSSNRKLVMTNSGDIGASFQWNAAKFEPDFSITPTEGYISPGMEIVFDLVFHPQIVSQEIRYDNLMCYIEHYKPLKLSLTGMCVGTAPIRETLSFTAAVRSADKKTISLANRSYANWNLKPVIDGEQWHGSETFNVEAGHTKNYELVYKPLSMTILDGKKHSGTLFFPMPDGSGLLYQLMGTADHPKPSANITREIPCKTHYTEILQVNNWMQIQQRFKTYIELVKPEKLDSATTLKGLDFVEVPAMSSVDYKLNFFAYREGAYSAKIVFVNEKTREYQYFLVSFKSITPGVLKTIELTSTVRKSNSCMLTVPNPLSNTVNALLSTNTPELNVASPVSLPPEGEASIPVEYLPLKEGESVGRVQVQCNELGLFIYEFRLKASAAGLERPMFFKTTLGSNQSLSAKVANYYKNKTDFSCQISPVDGSNATQDFTVEKTISAAAGSVTGSEVPFDVTYEPSAVGDFKAMLEVSSTTAGDFQIPLFASCLPPKPQGPYVIKANSSTAILFKNVFNQPVNFYMTTDNKCFSVKDSDTIRAKKSHSIMVYYEGNPDGSKNAKMGKLKVYCPRELTNGENIVWIFYLKGVTP
ncbi:hydrocephalus-inducing protein-like isoform X4 [Convolutriloba macropyga]|uniref:hydrocephalus-inducing protein-like isoform X4 n=1 Tax=Convolutriloba macropyga TaxID=536237 RepID=UPI003F527B49